MTDHEICYRALQIRDRRFDGRFFTAVLTTGIYCRPICPARTPARVNIRFYPSAAAAEAGGFRPCLRCRPEAAPDSAQWLGSQATVARALRLIDEGFLDEGGLSGLACRLGVGARQLRRLFSEHLGASPVAVAQTRRVGLSKQLLEQTELPLAQIAFAAGFSSLRRFNAVFLKTYGRPPSAFRRKGGQPGGISMRLAFRPPFRWQAISDELAPHLFAGCESIDRTGYHRLQRTATGYAELSVHPTPDGLFLKLPDTLATDLPRLRTRARRMFDLDADPMAIARQLQTLCPDPERLRLPGAWDPFEAAVRVVLGQEVSVEVAMALAGRLVTTYGDPVREGKLSHLFPRPEVLSEAPLESLGLPEASAKALRLLARAVTEGVDLAGDPGRLMIPGMGPGAIAMLALRLGEPDAFPTRNLILQNRSATPDEAALEALAEEWRPFRGYAARALGRLSPVQETSR